jgi:hypothetical protein
MILISTLVRFLIVLSATSHSSSATWEIRPDEKKALTVAITKDRGDMRTEIMRDDDDAAFKFFDGKRQCINGGHVQVICRFIYNAVSTIVRS